MPPTTKTAFQPNRAMSPAAAIPPRKAPSEKPQNMIITAVARTRLGAYSLVSAIAFGIAPPSPRPGTKRRRIRGGGDFAAAVDSANNPEERVERVGNGFA